MIRKMRIRIISITMIFVFLLLTGLGSVFFYFTEQNLAREALDTMEILADNPFQLQSSSSSSSSSSDSLPYLVVLVNRWNSEIIGVTGGAFDVSDSTRLSEMLNAAISQSESSGILKEYNVRYYIKISSSETCIVFADMASEQESLKEALKYILLSLAGAFFLCLILSIFLARRATAPVEKAWNEQRQFVADASHELKTPLTVILTNAEMLCDPGISADKKEQFSRNILTMSQRMRELVESLLLLARADNGQRKAVFVRTDLSRLADNALLPYEPIFFEKGLTLTSSVEEGLFVQGDPSQLSRVCDILLDNAAKYAPTGTEVSFTLRKSARHTAELIAANESAPLTKKECADIFRRFYRLDPSREEAHSAGLGLPIAESILQEHGGKIRAEYAEGKLSFFLNLPLSEASS